MTANEAQKSAITHVNGPMLVLAGPGSGKTFVITERIRYLIYNAHIPPEHILVITFTNAAAEEMKKRFQRLIGNEKVPVYFGTFHAVYFHILQQNSHYCPRDILKQEDQYHYLKEIIAEQKLDVMYPKEWMNELLSQISCLKNDMPPRTTDEYLDCVYPCYMKKCRDAGKLDFDDMLSMCLELLQAREDILQKCREQYQYILIDEFQDINPVQYKIIKLLAAPRKHLFIVGDDDQSIYGFRGARPEIMLGFEKEFRGCKRVVLDTNYRSTTEIVRLSHQLIRHNKRRFEKHLTAAKGSGGRVVVQQYDNIEQELAAIKAEIQELQKTYLYCDMAILYRTNFGERLLQKRFSYEKEQGLTLSTIHGAKGLEYEVVFIIDIIAGNIPHSRAKKKCEVEEERRLFYVAITRAKQKLYLLSVRKHFEKQVETSRFMKEIKHPMRRW